MIRTVSVSNQGQGMAQSAPVLRSTDAVTLHLVKQDRNPATVYLASLAPSGRRAMAGRLRVVADVLGHDLEGLPWHQLRFEHLQAVRTKLTERRQAPATVNLTLSAVRGVMRAAFNLGQIHADQLQRVCSVGSVKGERLPAGRALTIGELTALLESCETTPAGRRDAALLALLFAAGLRRAEVVNLDLTDYDQDSGELKVTGKGNKQRLLYVTNGAADALADWLTVRGATDGPLFLPTRKGGTVENRRMTAQAVYNILKGRAVKAGIADFSPHDLRRTFVSELLDKGADLATVQKLAGHANIQTTAKYDRRGEAAKRKAVDLLHVPYRRNKT